jgi:transposase
VEATGDYWKPVFFLLESRGFDCELYNAAQVKALPGRPKNDLLTELRGLAAAQAKVAVAARHSADRNAALDRSRWP